MALASVVNNLSSTLIGALSVDAAEVPAATKELMIDANVIGNDLGPKFTSIGSLAILSGCTCWPARASGSAGAGR